jgi:hypothetical protein
MIQANELRIGNWYVNQWGEYLQVDPDLLGADNLESYPNPIPVTPEILEKCGFEHIGSEWRFKADFTECFEVKDGKIFYTGGEGVCYGVGCQYLHELQNLVYSITKKELIYKP